MAFSTSNVQPRSLTPISFNGFTRLNFSRTSVSGTISFSVTTAIRASGGMRFKAKLQPTHPARLAVVDRGGRLMMAEGEHTRPRVWFATPRREHWGKTFDAGARRRAREARALPSLS